MDFDAWVAKVDELSGGKPIPTDWLKEAHTNGLTPEQAAQVGMAVNPHGPWLANVLEICAVIDFFIGVTALGLVFSTQYQFWDRPGWRLFEDQQHFNFFYYLLIHFGAVGSAAFLYALARYIRANPKKFGF